ncbi:probable inactive protein kinase DDB_G0270444 isoform X4 [Anabrus simplex]|uniref:probable inactive protein kinase DDB_G0270444 isoform X4 n=1 Tax=Anabrus simplex TaxID=316456 RepID=UPI0035A37AAB
MVNEKYSLEQRLCLYDSYVKFGSAKKTQKLFREKYPTEIIPSKSAIHKLVNHVRLKGTLLDLKKKPRQVLPDDVSDTVGSKSKKSKSTELSASELLERQLQAVREKVLADAESDEEKISIKDEPTWTKESEDSPSGDSENSNQEITTNVKKEPGVSLLEEPTFVSVKQEPEEYLEGEEVPLEKKIKCEVEMTGHQRLREKTLKENLPLCSAQQVNRGSCFHE